MYGIIYKTTNLINNKIYVGQTIRINRKKYYGSGIYLNAAIKKYGKENFIRETIEKCSCQEELDSREIYWIKKLKPEYNIDLGGNGTGKYTEERRNQMKKYRLGKTYEELYGTEISIIIREKQSKLKKGIKKSEKTKKNMRKPKSTEHRKNISKSRMGIKFSDEHCKNLSKSLSGEKHPLYGKSSPEKTKIKIGNANRGEKNGMYGKSLYDIWLKKYGKDITDEMWKKYKNPKNHPMYGRCVYDIWLEKYGKEEADRRQNESNRKRKECWKNKKIREIYA